jgi:hypothetical protein
MARAGLKQYGVGTAVEAVDMAGGVWRAVTDDWLTHRRPTSDSNKSRWPVSEEWRCVQATSFSYGADRPERLRELEGLGSAARALPQLNGLLVSWAAYLRMPNLNEALRALEGAASARADVKGRPFAEQVRARQLRIGLP